MKIRMLHLSKMKGVSGSENHLLTLLSGLDKSRFEAHFGIIVEPPHLSKLQDYKRALERAGIPVTFFAMRKNFDATLLWRLRTFIRHGRFDLVHTHLIHADLYGTLAAKCAGISKIVSSRHNDDKFRHNRVLRWLNRSLARYHTKIIVISDWVGTFLQTIEGIPAGKIVRIHYGLSADTAISQADPQYVRQQFQIPYGVPIIGTIGQLAEQKGQTYLLEAVKQILPQFPTLRVVIIGEGNLRDQLEHQAKALGIDAQVIFTGYRTDAIKLMSGFDAFVFPSLWEGFGLVLLEAMALKKVIVASHVSAIPESVIDGKTGFLVPPRNVEQLARAMTTVLSDQKLAAAMGEAGYAHLLQSFSVEKMLRTTETLYSSL